MNAEKKIGVVGAGTMGAGIALNAILAGNDVVLYELKDDVISKAMVYIQTQLNKMVEKGRLTDVQSKASFGRIHFTNNMGALSESELVIEAIIEDLKIKQELFSKLEEVVSQDCILASNTSSLSISALAGSCKQASRIIGIHFFNPAHIMPLVEIVPALQTENRIVDHTVDMINSWNKLTVRTKDTPGFIVNRVARPYYSEAIRILEEGIADCATIDHAMTDLHGFKMGPFTLMDFIGHDVNYAVTKSVWESCFYEPRYKPSFTQRNLVSAGWLGRKSGRGFYDYSKELPGPKPDSYLLQTQIANRILVMLFNEAADALYYGIATREDLETAMTKGVNYPKGLIEWAIEFGIDKCLADLNELQAYYREERYRCSPGLLQLMSS